MTPVQFFTERHSAKILRLLYNVVYPSTVTKAHLVELHLLEAARNIQEIQP